MKEQLFNTGVTNEKAGGSHDVPVMLASGSFTHGPGSGHLDAGLCQWADMTSMACPWASRMALSGRIRGALSSTSAPPSSDSDSA